MCCLRQSTTASRCTQVKVCFRETNSPSRAPKIHGHKAFQITHTHFGVLSISISLLSTQLTTAHTVELRWGASLSADIGDNPGRGIQIWGQRRLPI